MLVHIWNDNAVSEDLRRNLDDPDAVTATDRVNFSCRIHESAYGVAGGNAGADLF